MTAKQFLEQDQNTELTEDVIFCDCDLTWDSILSIMERYGKYCEDHAPLPQHIQEALNSGDGTYRP